MLIEKNIIWHISIGKIIELTLGGYPYKNGSVYITNVDQHRCEHTFAFSGEFDENAITDTLAWEKEDNCTSSFDDSLPSSNSSLSSDAPDRRDFIANVEPPWSVEYPSAFGSEFYDYHVNEYLADTLAHNNISHKEEDSCSIFFDESSPNSDSLPTIPCSDEPEYSDYISNMEPLHCESQSAYGGEWYANAITDTLVCEKEDNRTSFFDDSLPSSSSSLISDEPKCRDFIASEEPPWSLKYHPSAFGSEFYDYYGHAYSADTLVHNNISQKEEENCAIFFDESSSSSDSSFSSDEPECSDYISNMGPQYCESRTEVTSGEYYENTITDPLKCEKEGNYTNLLDESLPSNDEPEYSDYITNVELSWAVEYSSAFRSDFYENDVSFKNNLHNNISHKKEDSYTNFVDHSSPNSDRLPTIDSLPRCDKPKCSYWQVTLDNTCFNVFAATLLMPLLIIIVICMVVGVAMCTINICAAYISFFLSLVDS